MKDKLSRLKPYLLGALVLTFLSVAYFIDNFQGKVLPQGDIIQFQGAAREIISHLKKDEQILWTNSQFGGMPTYQISATREGFPLKNLAVPAKPRPWKMLFIMLITGYIFFVASGASPWLAAIGAIALSFTSGNLIILEAGHNTKADAISYIPLVLAGVVYLFRKKWLLGINLLTIGFALNVYVNHFQITYYLGFIIGIWFLYELVNHIQQKKILDWVKIAGISLVCVAAAISANSLNLMLTKEYSDYSIRGKSDLSISKENKVSFTKPSEGLDRDYAFQWSNGWADLPTLIIPNYAGGGSNTDLGSNSVFEGKINPQAIKNFPFAYWGALPFTSGPIYFGASVFLLLILALFFYKGQLKWWLLGLTLFSIILSMGKNGFAGLNFWLFDHLPLYNKFRAPTMALTIAQVCVPILGILGLRAFIQQISEKTNVEKHLKTSFFIAAGLVLVLTFFSSVFTDFGHTITDETGMVVKDYDQEVQEQYNIGKDLLLETRADLLRKDGLRSLFFIIAIFVALWLIAKQKVKTEYALLAIGLLVTADLWSVDKRYLSSENFVPKRQLEAQVKPSAADLEILKDKSNYRVLDLTANPMSSASASNFHNSIGGYSAVKIRRYQELFDWHIADYLQKGDILNSAALNMLNTKYVLFKPQNATEPAYNINPNALGNAWFVNSVSIAANADSAILQMENFNPKNTAIVEKIHADILGGSYTYDSTALITLTTYHPEKLTYKSNSSTEGVAVFSEIFYDKGWNAYIDNKLVPHGRANFVLRALKIPSGEHTVEFKFEPETYKTGKKIGLAANYAILLVLLGSIVLGIRNMKKEEAA